MNNETPDISEIATEGIQRLLGEGISYFEDMLNGSDEGEFVTTYQIWDQDSKHHFATIMSESADFENIENKLLESHPNPVCYVGCYSMVWKGDGDPVDGIILRLYDSASPYIVTALQRYDFTDQKFQAIDGPSIIDTKPNEAYSPLSMFGDFLKEMNDYEDSAEEDDDKV